MKNNYKLFTHSTIRIINLFFNRIKKQKNKFSLLLIPFFLTGCGGIIGLALTPITYPTQKLVEWSLREASMNPYNNPNYIITDECAKDIARAASKYGGLIFSDDEISNIKKIFNKKINQNIDKSWNTEKLIDVNVVRFSGLSKKEFIEINEKFSDFKKKINEQSSNFSNGEEYIDSIINLMKYIDDDSTVYISRQDKMNINAFGLNSEKKSESIKSFFDFIINKNSNKLELVLLTVMMGGVIPNYDNSTGIESYPLNNCHIK